MSSLSLVEMTATTFYLSSNGGRCLLLVSVLLTLLFGACHAEASPSSSRAAPSAIRTYSLLVEELTPSLDEAGTRPTLVSVTTEMTLTLPTKVGATAVWEGDSEMSEIDAAVAESLTFDESFDPLWYFALRRRGFDDLDWSGCGGKWRPEWSIAKEPLHGVHADSPVVTPTGHTDALFHRLRHYLSHHVVCTFSAVSFCGASRERHPSSQFQWAAQFFSTLTSSPLSWTADTPRHSRPNGIVLQQRTNNSTSEDAREAYWCSFHLVYHDTLCTQHVSPILNSGRYGHGVQEGLPPGIFKATVPSFVTFFKSPFHHFNFRAAQRRQEANTTLGTPPTVQLKVTIRMSMVIGSSTDLDELGELWSRELAAYAREGHLQIHIGPGGLAPKLRATLPASAVVAPSTIDKNVPTESVSQSPLPPPSLPTPSVPLSRFSPEVFYEVHTHGKHNGYLTVSLQPALALLNADAGEYSVAEVMNSSRKAASPHVFRLQEGDVVRTLVLFPLHLVRPSLYNMESLIGSTTLLRARTDISSNTLAVLLETTMTSVHMAAFNAAHAQARKCHLMAGEVEQSCRSPHDGILLGRFALALGWAAMADMPPDDNSNRLVPQPVALISRLIPSKEGDAGRGESNDFCHLPRRREQWSSAPLTWGAAMPPQLDHEDALAAIFNSLNASLRFSEDGGSAEKRFCVYWARSTFASGTTIPTPDSAMVFNVLSLGLIFTALTAGLLMRLTRRFTCAWAQLPALMR